MLLFFCSARILQTPALQEQLYQAWQVRDVNLGRVRCWRIGSGRWFVGKAKMCSADVKKSSGHLEKMVVDFEDGSRPSGPVFVELFGFDDCQHPRWRIHEHKINIKMVYILVCHQIRRIESDPRFFHRNLVLQWCQIAVGMRWTFFQPFIATGSMGSTLCRKAREWVPTICWHKNSIPLVLHSLWCIFLVRSSGAPGYVCTCPCSDPTWHCPWARTLLRFQLRFGP